MANTTTNTSGNKLSGVPTLVKIPPNYPVEPQPGKLSMLLDYNDKEIYHKFSPYTDNTNLLKFGREQPYIWRYIDEKDKSSLPPIPADLKALESRVFPLRSGGDDLVRMGIYLTSGRGVEFLTKQLLLQAQQTYDETGVYNPLETMLATAHPVSLGIVPRPQRHINISGGILGALASIIGINIQNGNSAPPSSVGQDALPTFNSADGKGLLRAQTALKAYDVMNAKWQESRDSLSSGLFRSLVKGAGKMATDTVKAFFKPAFPLRQKGVLYRMDENMYDRMREDASGRLSYSVRLSSAPGEDISWTIIHSEKENIDVFVAPLRERLVLIKDIRQENLQHIKNNKNYQTIDNKRNKMPYFNGRKYGWMAERNYGSQQYRLARAGAGDAINQIGVIGSKYSNKKDGVMLPIGGAPKNYPAWEKWIPYEDDIIAFFFYDVVNEKYLPFRATVKGISDTTTAYWDELRFIGRADQIYTYNGFVRSLAFQFTTVITSIADLLPTWQKINYLKTSLKPAGYTSKGTYIFNKFMIPPMFMLTIGDMYKYQPIVITSVTVNIPENANWETLNENNSLKWSYNDLITSDEQTAQLPKEADISIACNLLEKERAVCGGVDFGHAPRGDDGNTITGEEGDDKPYLQKPTEFSAAMMKNVRSLGGNNKESSAVLTH